MFGIQFYMDFEEPNDCSYLAHNRVQIAKADDLESLALEDANSSL